MKFIKKLLGIDKLEKRLSRNEKEIQKLEKINKSETSEDYEKKVIKILKYETSTATLAKKLKIDRTYASKILNQLEKKGKVYEASKKGRTIFYKSR